MEILLEDIVSQLSWPLLLLALIATLYVLGKGADWLVTNSVILSYQAGIPTIIVAATIVSLGTSLPEVAISVLAALRGNPGLALGNAVGSIICNSGLIIGIAALIKPLPLDHTLGNRQGWWQLGAGILLVLVCIPFSSLSTLFSTGGNLHQLTGLFFLILLLVYVWLTVKWAREQKMNSVSPDTDQDVASRATFVTLLLLLLSIALVVVSSWLLIPVVSEVALRLSVPQSIIAATIVAFGTSVPELITAIAATRKGRGEIALGTVIGSDVLNSLLVAGAAAAVTPAGLRAPAHFFTLLFPTMLFILVVFRFGYMTSGSHLKRPYGIVLLAAYVVVTILSYAW